MLTIQPLALVSSFFLKHAGVFGITISALLLLFSTVHSAVPVPVEAERNTAATSVAASDSVSVPAFELNTTTLKQGQIGRLIVRLPEQNASPFSLKALKLSFGSKSYPLYPQSDGALLALLPIDPLQTPGTLTLKVVDTLSGKLLLSKPFTIQKAGFKEQRITVSRQTAGLEPEAGELETIQQLKNLQTADRYWSGSFTKPVPDCQNSPFGVKRIVNGKFSGNYHKGVDQRSPAGRPIKAINAGKVFIARNYRLHGGTVGLDHGQGVTSIYIHQSKIHVKPGQLVEKGQTIGEVGSTGFASGPHLHWGLYVHGVTVDPTYWVPLTPC